MKLNKLLLTIPALSCVVPTLASCSCSKSNGITISINDSDKIQKTEVGKVYGYFTLHASSAIGAGDINITKFEVEGTEPAGKYIYEDEEDKTTLYLIVWFDEKTIVGGDYCKFNIDLLANQKTTSSLTGLKLTYMAEHNILPKTAFNIDDSKITGIKEDFDTTDYDTLEVPSDITTIGASAFKDKFTTTTRSTIKTLIINKSLTIEANAFNGCTAFTTLDISKVVAATGTITAGTDSFTSWNTTGSIVYTNGITSYDVIDYALCDGGLPTGWFDTTVTRKVPTSDLSITDKFVKANWTYKNMPNHIKKLCNTLDMIDMDIEEIVENGFYSESDDESLIPTSITTLGLPKSLLGLNENSLRKCPCSKFINPTTKEVSERLVMPPKVITAFNYSLADMPNLHYIELNENFMNIGIYAFENNVLYGISIPSTVTNIAMGAFQNSSELVCIDVTAVTGTDVPANWSKDASTFSGMPESGWILCKPENATKWTNYFNNFDFFKTGKWQITDDVDILKEYTPTVPARTGETFATTDAMMVAYAEAYSENKTTFLYDEMIWTIQKYITASDYDIFNLKVNNLNYDTITHTISFMLTYRVVFSNDTNTYEGFMLFSNMDINTFNKYKQHEGSYYQLSFKNILEQTSCIVKVYEVKTDKDGNETIIVNAKYDKSDFPTKMSVENFGTVWNKLNIFTFDASGSPIFEIRSHYLMNCKVQGE